MDKEQALARLTQSVEYLKDRGQARNQTEIATLMGLRQQHISAALKGDPKRLTERFLRKFASAYSDYINGDWLLTGEGNMELPDKSLRAHIGVKATAGFMSGIIERDNDDDMHTKSAFLPDYDFTIVANGDSMLPKIESGDILACRIVSDRINLPIGKICVIDSNEGAVVKVLREIKDSEVILHSLNPEYNDYPLPASSINNIAVVVGMVRAF